MTNEKVKAHWFVYGCMIGAGLLLVVAAYV